MRLSGEAEPPVVQPPDRHTPHPARNCAGRGPSEEGGLGPVLPPEQPHLTGRGIAVTFRPAGLSLQEQQWRCGPSQPMGLGVSAAPPGFQQPASLVPCP